MTHALATHLVTIAAAGLLLAFGAEIWQRRTVLQRLHAALGMEHELRPAKQVAAFLDILATRLPFVSDPDLRTALEKAGYPQRSAPLLFVTLRLACMGAAFGLTLAQGGALDDPTAWLEAIFAAFFSARLLAILLKARGDARQWTIRRELPPVIDIILMVLNSGASIDQCLRYVAGVLDQTAPVVGAILRRCVSDIEGGVPYDVAFERFGQRLGIEEGYDLAALIKQALLQGGEIVRSLDGFGAELGEKRVAAARERIGQKSVQLTLAMLVFFMPVLMVVLAGPAVSTIFDTLGTVKHHMHARTIPQ